MAAITTNARSREDDRELHAAHARIEQLERRIGGSPPPPRAGSRRIVLRAAFVSSLLLIACAAGRMIISEREAVVQASPPAPPPRIPAGALSWRAGAVFHDRGPSLVDIDGDGAKDIIGLAWRHGDDVLPLHVVAIDRKTYAVKWRAGAFPSRWRDPLVHLELIDGRIVVSDGAGASHALDPRTGAELEAPTRARSDWSDDDRRSCPGDATMPCTMPSPPVLEAKLLATFHKPVYPIDFLGGSERITVVSVSGERGGDSQEHAVRWDPEAKKLLWNAPLVPPPQKEKVATSTPKEWSAIAQGRFLHLYQHVSGEYRLAARDTKSGTLIYDAVVPALGDGSVIGELTADMDEAFIVANESLLVIDGATGATTHRFQRF